MNRKSQPQGWNYSRREDIQGLRAIAVTSVVCFHARLPLPGGFTGVDIFFVISGFVITLLLDRQWSQYGSISLRSFYLRRFKRLMPALALVVSATIALGVFYLSPIGMQTPVAVETGVGAILLCANAVIARETGGYFNLAAAQNPLLNLWSLSVEEQFYLFFPAILVFSFAMSRRLRLFHWTPIVIVGGLTLFSFLAALVGSSNLVTPAKIHLLLGFYSPVSRAWEFGVGAALALLRTKMPRNPVLVGGLASGGALLILFSFFAISGKSPYPGLITLLPVLGSLLLIAAGTSPGHISLISRLLALQPLARLGDMSYSWYLWHWPAIAITSKLISANPVALTAAALLSFIPAFLSYRYVENPLRGYVPTGRLGTGKLMGAVLAPPLLVCCFYLVANTHGYWLSKVKVFQDSINPEHAAERTGCGTGFVPSVSSSACLWNADERGVPIYLTGDSNAGHISEAVIRAGKELGSPVRVFSKGGCAPIARSWSNQSDLPLAECRKFNDDALSFLEKAKPGLVVLGLSESNWLVKGVKVGPTRATETADPEKALRYINSDLIDLVRKIQKSGHRVLLVLPVSKFVTADNALLYDPDGCTVSSILTNRCIGTTTVSVVDEDRRQSVAREGIRHAAMVTGSDLLDLRPSFCSSAGCSLLDYDGVPLYRDAGHLSVTGSKRLSGIFLKKLKAVAKS